MQELEKILEEIDNLYVDETDFGIECNMENRSDIACDNCYECIKEACKNIIRKHMNDGWIPVEERLPEAYAEVLISMYYTGFVTTGHINSDKEWRADKYITGLGVDVKAWRPLPDPYKPERSAGE